MANHRLCSFVFRVTLCPKIASTICSSRLRTSIARSRSIVTRLVGGPSPPGAVTVSPRGVVLNGGSIEMVLAERHNTQDHSWSHGMNGHRPTMHLTVENLDERFRELSSVAEVVVHPEATHWGTRWFVVVDPDGNLIAYEQPDSKGSEP